MMKARIPTGIFDSFSFVVLDRIASALAGQRHDFARLQFAENSR